MKLKKTFAALLLVAGLAGCATTIPNPTCTTHVGDVGYTLANQLYQTINSQDYDKTFVVGSIVNLDDVNEVSPLGRLVSEHIGSRMAQLGLKVTEPRLRNVLVISKGGEHVLSREAKDLAAKTNAYAFITGTVTKMQGRYYFNARLIRAKDSQVLGAYDICLTGKVKEAGL